MKIQLWAYLIIACLSIFSISSCGKKASEDTSAEMAGQAAKAYYDQLLHGDFKSFVAGRYQPDSIPASYHDGIKEVKYVSAKADTSKHVADVFLKFVYGNGTAEEVIVPMVEHKGVWYMR